MTDSFREIAQQLDKSELDQRITQRELEQANRGVLSQLFYDSLHVVSRADEDSLANMKALRSGTTTGDIDGSLRSDSDATDWRNEFARCASTFTKTVPLFMGKSGYALSAAVNGLDQVHADSSSGMMAMDFTAGAAKGLALKYGMDKFGASTLASPYKGAILGGGSSLIDSAFAVRTWYDPESGNFHVKEGLVQTAESTAIGAGVGAVAFPLGAQLGRTVTPAAEAYFGKTISQPVLNSLVTGWSFGTASGATAETVREIRAGETLNPVRIAERGLTEGATTMFAAGLGNRLARFEASKFSGTQRIEARPDFESAADRTKWLTDNPGRILDVALSISRGEQVSDQMVKAISENPEIAKSIDNPQIRTFLRSAMLSNDPVAGLEVLMKTGAMSNMLPEVAEMIGPKSAQDPKYHPEGNVWEHVKLVLAEHVARTQSLPEEQRYTERLAAWLHDIAKPDTQKIWPDGGISNYKHDIIGAEKVQNLLQRLGEKPEVIEQVTSIIKDHMRMHDTPKMKADTLRSLLADPFIEAKIRLQASDSQGTANPDRIGRTNETFLTEKLAEQRAQQEVKAKADAEIVKPIVNGKTLIAGGMKTGPQVGEVLDAAYKAQLKGEFDTFAGANEWLAQTYNLNALVSEPSNLIAARVNDAIETTKPRDDQYFQKTLAQRTTDAKGSRYENMTPEQLETAIRNTQWQPFDHPAIKAPAVAFKGNLPGRLGMADLDQVPAEAKLWLVDPKGTGAWSLATRGVPGPQVDFSTLIVGPENGQEIVYTFHPGEPVSPSPVSKLPEAIAARRTSGSEQRIPVSREEARALGLTKVKIEDD